MQITANHRSLGAALAQIAEHRLFKTLAKSGTTHGHYKVNADVQIVCKYAREVLMDNTKTYHFVFSRQEVADAVAVGKRAKNTFVVLTCADETICCMPYAQWAALLAEPSTSHETFVVVSELRKKSVRVQGPNKTAKPELVAHNAYPDCLFA